MPDDTKYEDTKMSHEKDAHDNYADKVVKDMVKRMANRDPVKYLEDSAAKEEAYNGSPLKVPFVPPQKLNPDGSLADDDTKQKP